MISVFNFIEEAAIGVKKLIISKSTPKRLAKFIFFILKSYHKKEKLLIK